MDFLPEIQSLKQKISTLAMPAEVVDKLYQELTRLELLLKSPNLFLEADREKVYIDTLCQLPWNQVSTDVLDLARAKQILDKHHHGLDEVKNRILEFLSVLILNKQKAMQPHLNSLCFVGLVGSGKTSLAYSIAESLGRPIIRIPFGGLASASQLRGESRMKLEAQPGLIMQAVKKARVKNPVILLDELDRVSNENRNDIMGALVEILDPAQNNLFLDHFLDITFDLSQVLFIATANNTNNISTAVMDRLEVVEMPFYTDQQKIVIGKDYILPEALLNTGLDRNMIEVDDSTWQEIVRPLGFDGGIRSLKRTIDNLARKVARQVVEGKTGPFKINRENITMYLNK